jgi:D-psicose/D-tagatose/L-ribulose 3-epimerase
MKTGMNLLLWTTHVTAEHFPILEKLKKTGFDGVEIPLFEGDAAHYQRIRRELDNLGLKCTTVCCVPPEANPISPDAALRTAGLKQIQWAIDMTAILGGEILAGPYHSPLAVFTGAGPTADEKKRATDVLRQAADHAQKAKVMLAIEYLNRFECYFLTTAAAARDLVKQVNHPHFRTMYDTFHANIEEKDIPSTIAAVADSFIHVHISENDRGTPGTGHVHWDETFKALRQVNYDGWLTIEAFGRALPALAAATRVWRDLFPSAEEVYTQGLRFMKEKWQKWTSVAGR